MNIFEPISIQINDHVKWDISFILNHEKTGYQARCTRNPQLSEQVNSDKEAIYAKHFKIREKVAQDDQKSLFIYGTSEGKSFKQTLLAIDQLGKGLSVAMCTKSDLLINQLRDDFKRVLPEQLVSELEANEQLNFITHQHLLDQQPKQNVVCIDEVHSSANTERQQVNFYQNIEGKKTFGFTATPNESLITKGGFILKDFSVRNPLDPNNRSHQRSHIHEQPKRLIDGIGPWIAEQVAQKLVNHVYSPIPGMVDTLARVSAEQPASYQKTLMITDRIDDVINVYLHLESAKRCNPSSQITEPSEIDTEIQQARAFKRKYLGAENEKSESEEKYSYVELYHKGLTSRPPFYAHLIEKKLFGKDEVTDKTQKLTKHLSQVILNQLQAHVVQINQLKDEYLGQGPISLVDRYLEIKFGKLYLNSGSNQFFDDLRDLLVEASTNYQANISSEIFETQAFLRFLTRYGAITIADELQNHEVQLKSNTTYCGFNREKYYQNTNFFGLKNQKTNDPNQLGTPPIQTPPLIDQLDQTATYSKITMVESDDRDLLVEAFKQDFIPMLMSDPQTLGTGFSNETLGQVVNLCSQTNTNKNIQLEGRLREKSPNKTIISNRDMQTTYQALSSAKLRQDKLKKLSELNQQAHIDQLYDLGNRLGERIYFALYNNPGLDLNELFNQEVKQIMIDIDTIFDFNHDLSKQYSHLVFNQANVFLKEKLYLIDHQIPFLKDFQRLLLKAVDMIASLPSPVRFTARYLKQKITLKLISSDSDRHPSLISQYTGYFQIGLSYLVTVLLSPFIIIFHQFYRLYQWLFNPSGRYQATDYLISTQVSAINEQEAKQLDEQIAITLSHNMSITNLSRHFFVFNEVFGQLGPIFQSTWQTSKVQQVIDLLDKPNPLLPYTEQLAQSMTPLLLRIHTALQATTDQLPNLDQPSITNFLVDSQFHFNQLTQWEQQLDCCTSFDELDPDLQELISRQARPNGKNELFTITTRLFGETDIANGKINGKLTIDQRKLFSPNPNTRSAEVKHAKSLLPTLYLLNKLFGKKDPFSANDVAEIIKVTNQNISKMTLVTSVVNYFFSKTSLDQISLANNLITNPAMRSSLNDTIRLMLQAFTESSALNQGLDLFFDGSTKNLLNDVVNASSNQQPEILKSFVGTALLTPIQYLSKKTDKGQVYTDLSQFINQYMPVSSNPDNDFLKKISQVNRVPSDTSTLEGSIKIMLENPLQLGKGFKTCLDKDTPLSTKLRMINDHITDPISRQAIHHAFRNQTMKTISSDTFNQTISLLLKPDMQQLLKDLTRDLNPEQQDQLFGKPINHLITYLTQKGTDPATLKADLERLVNLMAPETFEVDHDLLTNLSNDTTSLEQHPLSDFIIATMNTNGDLLSPIDKDYFMLPLVVNTRFPDLSNVSSILDHDKKGVGSANAIHAQGQAQKKPVGQINEAIAHLTNFLQAKTMSRYQKNNPLQYYVQTLLVPYFRNSAIASLAVILVTILILHLPASSILGFLTLQVFLIIAYSQLMSKLEGLPNQYKVLAICLLTACFVTVACIPIFNLSIAAMVLLDFAPAFIFLVGALLQLLPSPLMRLATLPQTDTAIDSDQIANMADQIDEINGLTSQCKKHLNAFEQLTDVAAISTQNTMVDTLEQVPTNQTP
jgi:hypothetical protein